MKKFLITSFALLTLSLVMAAVVFMMVLNARSEKQPKKPIISNETEAVTVPKVPEEGVSLKELPISDSQAEVLDAMGIDRETTISPAQIACASNKLSPERVAEISSGDKPTAFEIAKLSVCLVAE